MKYNYCLIDKMATPTPTPPNPTVATLKQVTKPTVPKFKGMCWGTQVDCYPDGEPEDVVTYATLLTPPEEGKEWSVFDGIDLLKYAAQAEPSYDTAADAVNCTVARELKITLTPPVLHRPGCYIAVPAARTVQVLNGVKSQYYGISVYVTVASRGVTAKVSIELVSSAKAIEKVIAEEQTATKSVVPESDIAPFQKIYTSLTEYKPEFLARRDYQVATALMQVAEVTTGEGEHKAAHYYLDCDLSMTAVTAPEVKRLTNIVMPQNTIYTLALLEAMPGPIVYVQADDPKYTQVMSPKVRAPMGVAIEVKIQRVKIPNAQYYAATKIKFPKSLDWKWSRVSSQQYHLVYNDGAFHVLQWKEKPLPSELTHIQSDESKPYINQALIPSLHLANPSDFKNIEDLYMSEAEYSAQTPQQKCDLYTRAFRHFQTLETTGLSKVLKNKKEEVLMDTSNSY